MRERVWSWKGQRPLSGWRSIVDTSIPWLRIDWHVLFLAGVLVATGLLFVRTMELADVRFGREGVSFGSHLKKVVVAMPFLFVGFFARPRWIRRNAWVFYVGAMALLVLVPIVGEERNNARRWIQLPLGFDIQPSELAKLGLIVALARVLYRTRMQRTADWVRVGSLALVPMVLVAAQPDLGTAITIVPISLGMAWLAGARLRAVAFVVLGGLTLGGLAWQLEWVEGYQKKRLDVWAAAFDNEALIEGRNGPAFHAYMNRVAIGNGGTYGRGLGGGVANEAGHLPERDCDSIFAVVAEEGGFVGATGLIAAYALFGTFLLLASGQVRERFARLLVGGVGLYFLSHFFINVGVNLGLLPMTGLPLPLISTGGSSLLASFLALGLALGVSARREATLDRDAFRS